jgi:hypothetical protein
VQSPDNLLTPYTYCAAEAAGASALCKSHLVTQRLATGVLTVSGRPLLTYFNSDGLALPLAGPLTASGSLTAADLAQVLSIELTVEVQTPNATKAAPTKYIQRVTMPNSQSVIRAGQAQTP